MTAFKADCPECGPDRHANVLHHANKRDEYDNGAIWFGSDYRLLQCRGCDKIYLQVDSYNTESTSHIEHFDGIYEEVLDHKIEYWPPHLNMIREEPDWLIRLASLDTSMYRLMSVVYKSINAEFDFLVAMAIRTAFDHAASVAGVGEGRNFTEKIDSLLSSGRIGKDERDTLAELIDAGNAAAHRGWKPSLDHLKVMIDVLENFVHRTFILGKSMKDFAQSVPRRQAGRSGEVKKI